MASLDRKTIKQSRAPGALQSFIAAAARRMRRVPRKRRRARIETRPVVVADHRDSVAALGPVAAGHILAAGERGAVGLRPGEDVVLVRRVAPAVDDLAFFGERSLLAEIVVAVQLREVARDDDSLGVLPGSVTDAILCVDRGCALCRGLAEISVPCNASGSRSGRQSLTVLICTREPAEIRTLAGARAGHEEC